MTVNSEAVLDRDALATLLREKHTGQTVVFTNGCYDLLHVGHVHTLTEAKALGDVLVVGINSDASVRRLKGSKRPVIPAAERAAMMAALKPVDYVTIFEEDTPIPTIEVLEPDIHVKGGDYEVESLPETPAVRAHGGGVVVVPFIAGVSTTDIVAKILENYR
jgi:rfaE bifunctional protein nucleotidyltransferase chain/domain